MHNIVKVLIFSIIAYITLFIIAKILGKKQIAQLSFIDYVVGITIGSIAAEMATDTQNPFYHYLLAMAVFLLFDLCITLLSQKTILMKNFFCGKPMIIIENGKINYEIFKKSKLTVEELIGMARDKNYFDLQDIAYGILETNGKLSILPKAEQKSPVCSDLKLNPPPSSLTEYIIIDGEIRKDTIEACGLTEELIKDKLKIKEKNELKNIFLASYDKNTKQFYVNYKTE